MKRLFAFLPVILLFITCKEDKDNFNYLLFITAGQSNGKGIAHTDIIPDYDSLGRNYIPGSVQTKNLDLNRDNIDDFELIYTINGQKSTGSHKLEIKPLGKNAVCTSKFDKNWVNDFRYGDTIYENNIWSDSIALLYYYYWRTGDHSTPPIVKDSVSIKGYWYENDSIYIGVKIWNNYSFFGWIDMKKFILRQYAITIPY